MNRPVSIPSREAVASAAPALDRAIAEAPRPAAPAAPKKNPSPRQEAQAAKWRKLLAPMLEPRGGRTDWEAAGDVAREHHVSQRHVFRLYKNYQRGGVGALAPKRLGPKKGTTGKFADNNELKRFVTAKYYKETKYVPFLAEILKREWLGPHLRHQKGDPPSCSAIRRFVEALKPVHRDNARLTKQQSDAKNAPYILTHRGSQTRVNEVWESDHRVLDVLVRNDCFPNAPEDAAVRLWLTCIQDLRSRRIIGCDWNVTPSSQTIANALRRAVYGFSFPENFLCDNGKDFKKVGAPGGLLEGLGIKVRYCTPRHPQSKQIEAFFNFQAQRFDMLFSEHGYTGPKPEMRPDFSRDAEKRHKQFEKGKREQSPFFAASVFMQLFAQFINEYNETHKHGGEGMDGRTPMEVFEELLPAEQRRIPNKAEIEHLFWLRERRTVRNCRVSLDNMSYSPEWNDGESNGGIYEANSTIVVVRRDPENMLHARAYEDGQNGAWIADLFSDGWGSQEPISHDQIKAVRQTGAKLRKASRQATIAYCAGVPSEIELLAQRGGISLDPAQQPRLPGRARRKLAPAFVSDTIEEDAELFRHVEIEDEVASPFVSDSVAKLKKAFAEEESA